MWNVECTRCGNAIEADSPDEIKTDVNDNPRHDDCPYADDPEYPVEFSMQVRTRSQEKTVLSRAFPHLTPKLESQRLDNVVPEPLQTIGNASLAYRVTMPDDGESIWDTNVTIAKVDGTPVADQLPRLVYECDECGTQIDGKAYYPSGRGRDLVHEGNKESRTRCGDFRPVAVSTYAAYDFNMSDEYKDELLEKYQSRYD